MLRLILPAALLMAGATARAEVANPADWLIRIGEAAHTANYQGVVIYRDAQKLETLKLFHRYRKGEERERLMSLTGEPREILRLNGRVTCILPETRTITVEEQANPGIFPAMPQDAAESLSQHYEFRDLGRARIAGRVCRGVRVQPRDAFRYGYEIWADEERHVPLKIGLMDSRGQMLEQLLFTEIAYPKTLADSVFVPEIDTTGYTQLIQEAPPPGVAARNEWAARRLPPGFHVKQQEVRVLPGNKGRIEHLLISDGLSTVSVFSARAVRPAQRPLGGMSQMGGVHAYGRTIGAFHVTVVGEVPPETVRMIGDNLHATEVPAADTVPAE